MTEEFTDFSILEKPVHGERHGIFFLIRAFVLAVRASHFFLGQVCSISFMQVFILYFFPVVLPKILLFSPLIYLILYCLRHIVPQFGQVREENLFMRFLAHSRPFPSRLAAEKAFNDFLAKRAQMQYVLEKEREWQVEHKKNLELPENASVKEYVQRLRAKTDNKKLLAIASDLDSLKKVPHVIYRCLPLLLEIAEHNNLPEEERKFVDQVAQALESEHAAVSLAEQMEFSARLKACETMLEIKGYNAVPETQENGGAQ